jgi:molybdenum cofactor cytidylyltransferase
VADVESCDCVLLAAGLSSRTSDWKMLLACGEVTMVEASVAAASPACARVIVVAGHRAEELVRLFRGRQGVQVEVNPRYEQGMLSSVACGAAAVRTPRFFLALADMPLVSPETYRLLLEAPAMDAVIPKYHGKKGHPLLLTAAVARAVVAAASAVVAAAGAVVAAAGAVDEAAAAPGQTLRDVLAGFRTLLLPVEDPHVLHDVDTDRDYRELLGDSAAAGGRVPPEAGGEGT